MMAKAKSHDISKSYSGEENRLRGKRKNLKSKVTAGAYLQGFSRCS